jgi:hypothetical protein
MLPYPPLQIDFGGGGATGAGGSSFLAGGSSMP